MLEQHRPQGEFVNLQLGLALQVLFRLGPIPKLIRFVPGSCSLPAALLRLVPLFFFGLLLLAALVLPLAFSGITRVRAAG